MVDPKVSVIIPAYNETRTIGDVIEKIRKLYPDFEIIVINDGSIDATADEAGKAGAAVYSHPYNIGNGAAIKSGIRVASGDIFIFMDGVKIKPLRFGGRPSRAVQPVWACCRLL